MDKIAVIKNFFKYFTVLKLQKSKAVIIHKNKIWVEVLKHPAKQDKMIELHGYIVIGKSLPGILTPAITAGHISQVPKGDELVLTKKFGEKMTDLVV